MEEAARIRNEAPLEVRPSLAAMLVQEQIQYRMFDSWDWFCITAGTEFVRSWILVAQRLHLVLPLLILDGLVPP
ncbi:hypothetical protein WJX82_006497 [Trebouxia sp. C0006]